MLENQFGEASQEPQFEKMGSKWGFARGWWLRAVSSGLRALAMEVAAEYGRCPRIVAIYFGTNKREENDVSATDLTGRAAPYLLDWAFVANWDDEDPWDGTAVAPDSKEGTLLLADLYRPPSPMQSSVALAAATTSDAVRAAYPADSWPDKTPQGALKRWSAAARGKDWKKDRKAVEGAPFATLRQALRTYLEEDPPP
jgi:hypothetical protein